MAASRHRAGRGLVRRGRHRHGGDPQYRQRADRLELPILVEGDPALINIYHVITLDPANGPHVNGEGGAAFLTFLLAPATQAVIGGFGVEEFGEPLFTPCADNACGLDTAATPAA